MIYIKISLVNKVAVSETALPMLTIPPQSVGLKSFCFTRNQVLGSTDAGEGIVFATLNYSTGEFSTLDVCMNHDDTISMPAGENIVFHINIPVIHSLMLDEFCNQFSWKRIS